MPEKIHKTRKKWAMITCKLKLCRKVREIDLYCYEILLPREGFDKMFDRVTCRNIL